MQRRRIPTVFALFCLLSALLSANFGVAQNPGQGLSDRMIVGYQGWFGCPKDFDDNKYWQHWFVKGVAPENFTVDLLPSVRDIDPKDLCLTQLHRPDGSPIYLYSAQNANVVLTHFRWMKDHGIDGAAVQRFIGPIADPVKRERSDNVLRNAMAAAEKQGRVFYICYDISGAEAATVIRDVRADWQHLVNDLKLTASRSYLVDHGKPVLELWGFGFSDRPGNADEVGQLINDLKAGRQGLAAATLVGGVPTNWRTLTADSKSDPAWAGVFRSYDVISPWSVGRFANDEGADAFYRDHLQPDVVETRRLGIRYMAVIFPGFSWSNLMRNRGQQGALNATPRRCGNFLWHQVVNALDARVNALYGAMFDEVDEGTAMFPTETRADKLPDKAKLVFLNEDGCSLPDDWYLRVLGKAADHMRHHSKPARELTAELRP